METTCTCRLDFTGACGTGSGAGGTPPAGGPGCRDVGDPISTWRTRPPFRSLPENALRARATLPLRGALATAAAPRHQAEGLDEASLRAGLVDALAEGPDRLGESDVGWLASQARLWPLYPVWPLLHAASRVLVETVEAECRAAGRGPTADAPSLARSLLDSVLPEVVRLTTRSVADAGGRSSAPEAPDGKVLVGGGRAGEESKGALEHAVAGDLLAAYQARGPALKFLAERGPLTHLVAGLLARHTAAFRLMLRRLRADHDLVRELAGTSVLRLEEAQVTGDLHEQGAVTVLRFSGGGSVVYKPRSLALEHALGGLFEWLERRSAVPGPRLPRSLDRGPYGWQAVVTPRPISSSAAAGDFYERVGALLALAYVLRAGDLHHENIVCDGDVPVVVDPECFFGAGLATTADGVDDQAGFRSATVLDSGILPGPTMKVGGGPALDMSALGYLGTRGKQVLRRTLQRDESGGLHFVARQEDLPEPTSLPIRDGRVVSVRGFEARVAHGFSAAYEVVRGATGELLAPDGPLAAAGGCRVRHVMRPTPTYARVLWELGHPGAARCALRQEEVLNALWPPTAADDPVMRAVFAHERQELLWGAIPTFSRSADGRDLEAGAIRLGEAYVRSGLDLVRERVARLSETDRGVQERLVDGSLRLLRIHPRASTSKNYAPVQADPRDRRLLLDTAVSLAERLAAAAVRGPGGTWWVTGHQVDPRAYALRPSPPTLYDGVAGLALFAGSVEAATGREVGALGRARDTMVQEAERLLEATSPAQMARSGRLGAFDGLWGCVYVAACLGVGTGEPALCRWAEGLAAELVDGLDDLRMWDVISGTAGIALVAAELARAGLGSTHRVVAERALDRTADLVAPVLRSEAIPTGFAHGMAGVATAFDRGARLFRSGTYRSAATVALEAERSQCYWDERGWCDPLLAGRDDPAQAHKCEGWCRGAGGIGLSRVLILAGADGAAMSGRETTTLEEEVELAEQVTRLRAFGRTHGLCHGALGAAEFLASGRDVPRSGAEPVGVDPAREVARYLGGVVTSGLGRRWVTGLPAALPDPGLMTGLAGIGFGLLRAVLPGAVARPLTLELPAGPSGLAAPAHPPGDGRARGPEVQG